MPNFWCPPSLTDIDKSERFWPPLEPRFEWNYLNYQNTDGLRPEADEVRKCIQAGKLESDLVPHNESLVMARIEDEIRKQIGVRFPGDDE